MNPFFELLLLPAERRINAGIDASPAAGQTAELLEGRRMQLAIAPPGLVMQIRAERRRIKITADLERKADIEISGSPIELARLFLVDERAPIREGHVKFAGDADVAERFRELLHLAAPDPEAELTPLVGERAAFQLANAARSLRHWVVNSASAAADDLADILQEDTELLPTPEEIDAFTADVRAAANDLARLEARGRQLRRHIEARGGHGA